MKKSSEGKSVPAKKTTAKKTIPAKTKRRSVKKVVPAEVKPGFGIDLVSRCVRALDDKKAENIEVIEVGETSSVTDFYVIATGTSDPHLRALRVALEKAVDEVLPAGATRTQNEPGSGWCCVDAFDVVIHIFSEEMREYYNLEELYKQGKKISVAKFLKQ